MSVGQERDICVIGGGASGLATLRIVSESPQFKAGLWRIIAYEARDEIGGVWYPAPPVDDPPLTPLYDSLTTNLPHSVMAYPDFPFHPSTPLFPRASVVHQYLKDYAGEFSLKDFIKLNTTVESARWDRHRAKWTVRTKSTPHSGEETETREFDLLIVANGHYRLPRLPDTPGLSHWLDQGKASHAALYRRPHDLGKVVLVVGGGPSGQDITSDMLSMQGTTVIHSATDTPASDAANLKRRGRVRRFGSPGLGEVIFEDGEVIRDVDYCILATGYKTWFPFFDGDVVRRALPPALIPPLPNELYDSSFHAFPLARHLFSVHPDIPPSALAFIGMPIRVVPFPLVEAQARAVVAVVANSSIFDLDAEKKLILGRHDDLQQRRGLNDSMKMSKGWLRFEDDEQWRYRDALHTFASVSDHAPHGVVPQWVRDIYARKGELREKWRALERNGEAEGFVRDVGESARSWEETEQEWLEVMKRVLAT